MHLLLFVHLIISINKAGDRNYNTRELNFENEKLTINSLKSNKQRKNNKILFNLKMPTYNPLGDTRRKLKDKSYYTKRGAKTKVHFYKNDYGTNDFHNAKSQESPIKDNNQEGVQSIIEMKMKDTHKKSFMQKSSKAELEDPLPIYNFVGKKRYSSFS
mmetsp:Transcript_6660/g.5775  ORF Transcript_6660/g.5775 Transcript_6660/m.5775 type:complete len:158 (-) Transcript_6660:52-525(-)